MGEVFAARYELADPIGRRFDGKRRQFSFDDARRGEPFWEGAGGDQIFEPGHQRFRTPRLAADGRQLRVAVGDDAAVPADDLGKEQRERRPVRHAVSAAHRPGTGMDRTERRMPGGGACEKPSEEGGAHRLGVV